MFNRKKLVLITSILMVVSSLSLSFGIYANAENSSIDYTSDISPDETTSSDENETAEDTESTENLTSNDELTLLKYSDFPTEFIDKVVIVGDSIASGFGTYDRLPKEQVLAVGSVGARNIHSFDFTVDGKTMDILDAISIKQPQYIFMSMGMNDVNLSSSDEYIENYNKNIDDILSVCPKATIIVMGITPVIHYSDFTSNDTIDSYNEALKVMTKNRRENSQKVYYINVSGYLKDENNALKDEFSSGDGIHLDQPAYDYIFTSMMNSLNWIQ